MNVLPDGSHDVLVIDAKTDVDDTVHFELAVVAGPNKGDVVMLHLWNTPRIWRLLTSDLPAARYMVWVMVLGSHPPQLRRRRDDHNFVETRVAAPGPGYVWIPGFHAWNGRQYVWRPGRWERAPRRNARWVPAHWLHDDRKGWYLVEGHWR